MGKRKSRALFHVFQFLLSILKIIRSVECDGVSASNRRIYANWQLMDQLLSK